MIRRIRLILLAVCLLALLGCGTNSSHSGKTNRLAGRRHHRTSAKAKPSPPGAPAAPASRPGGYFGF